MKKVIYTNRHDKTRLFTYGDGVWYRQILEITQEEKDEGFSFTFINDITPVYDYNY